MASEICASLLTFLLILSAFIYFYIKYLYSYWQRRGVKSLKPSFPFGNFSKGYLHKQSLGQVCEEIYNSTDEPFIGVYSVFRPVLIVCDPKLIQSILVTDFQHFADRGVYSDEKNDPLSANLFTITSDKWKELRAKLSPAFTSGRLKEMFSTIVNCGTPLKNVIKTAAKNQKEIDAREIISKFTTTIIASVAFGLDIDCFKNQDEPFRKYGRNFFAATFKNGIRTMLRFVAPKLMKSMKIRFVDKDFEDFMTSTVKENIELREEHNIVRKDFFQLLIQLRNGKLSELDSQWETIISKDENTKKLSLQEMAANAFVFFVAGFETSATTMSFCLYEVAKNQEIQRKIQEEIDSVLSEHNGQITFDSINEMRYLESCISGSFIIIFFSFETIFES